MRVRQFRRNGNGPLRGGKRIRDFVLPEIDARETGVAYGGMIALYALDASSNSSACRSSSAFSVGDGSIAG